MARKPSAPPPKPAQLTPTQMRAAIPQLQRRVEELTAVDVERLTDENAANVLEDLRIRIEATLENVFGHGTLEYDRYHVGDLDPTPLDMLRGRPSIYERRPHIRRGIASAISTLNSAISILKEQLEDSGESAASRAVTAYQGLDLHPEIAR